MHIQNFRYKIAAFLYYVQNFIFDNEHHHQIFYIQISLVIKFYYEQFWILVPKLLKMVFWLSSAYSN